MNKSVAIFLFSTLSAQTALGQLSTELKPETEKAFRRYVAKIEASIKEREQGTRPFLWLDEHPAERKQALGTEIVVHQFGDDFIKVKRGLIHHWLGGAFMPGVTLEEASALFHDVQKHVEYYPDVVAAEILSKEGDVVRQRIRTQMEKAAMTIVLDMELEAHHRQVNDQRYTVRSYSIRVSEVKDHGTAEEMVLPDGEGFGFMWRLNSYWRLEAIDGGVLSELETVSLSRDIPFGLGVIIKPFIENLPQEFLISILTSTRNALSK